MKKLLSLILALCMAASLAAPALAIGTAFSDVRDSETAAAVETLRLMGVLGGYSDGTFRPGETLNRAQFCKMVIYAINADKDLGRYTTVTVFPDVKPSYWAAPYINLAARGKSIIAGYSDGCFHPERSVTLGHAVTMLLRLLGYKDGEIGGVWPDGYLAVAGSIGLIAGVGTDGYAPLTRAQAARLFLNLLRVKNTEGNTLYTLGAETTLISLDASSRKMVTGEGSYEMEKFQASSTLVGTRGQVVMNGAKAMTFLPVEAAGAPNAAGAVILSSASSSLRSITGENSEPAIVKNGVSAGRGALQPYDVAIWSDAAGAALVCDTRVTAYYENCFPSPAAPTSIEILGGTTFTVLPTAQDSLSAFKPGQMMTVLLTADGRVAGAADPDRVRGNALAAVSGKGVSLLCGGTEIPLNCAMPAEARPVARISANKDGDVTFSRLEGGVSGDVNAQAMTVGRAKMASNIRIYDGEELVALEDLERTVSSRNVVGGRLNWAGDVELLVLNGGSTGATVLYGRTKVTYLTEDDGESYSRTRLLQVEYPGGKTEEIPIGFEMANDKYVKAVLNRGKTRFTRVDELDALKNVSASAWMGKTAVTAGGKTYPVASDVPCFNADSERWISLDQALVYAPTCDLYVSDGAVRLIEVHTD